MQHFIKHTKPSLDNPVTLITDNHETRISISATVRCKEAGIILLTFHPHSRYKMQPKTYLCLDYSRPIIILQSLTGC
ncbi:hypothetical protein NQ314_011112 [Rhamnusium bicolor]|uniref:Uncharacterized protein n=1 Tax=Rhamnusium bicolor TaxID=1586634 RepID=A0AAV8XLB5_9CUCU|nr:hypothetical protein NQ314_011112 [Rhamnusium bicolor]